MQARVRESADFISTTVERGAICTTVKETEDKVSAASRRVSHLGIKSEINKLALVVRIKTRDEYHEVPPARSKWLLLLAGAIQESARPRRESVVQKVAVRTSDVQPNRYPGTVFGNNSCWKSRRLPTFGNNRPSIIVLITRTRLIAAESDGCSCSQRFT